MAIVLLITHASNLEDVQEILVDRKIVIGNSLYCDIVLKDKNIASLQCEIMTHKSGHVLARNLDAKKDIYINNSRVKRAPIGPADILRIGTYNIEIDHTKLSPAEASILNSEFVEYV